MKLKKYILCMLALAILLVAGGCDPQGEKQTPSSSSSSSSAVSSSGSSVSSSSGASADAKQVEAKELTVKVYYPNDEGERLVAVSRKVKLSDGTDKYTAAMKSLMQGTKEKGQSAIIPRQAKLRSVKVKDGVATVDFSGDILKHFVGGSTGEEMLVGSVVNTLTEFPEVTSVQILIDGNPVESLAGHMDLTVPIKRMESILPK
ncbi:MAG: GerMN domain-containing protein [Selenomonadaceae bacterium]|nr:GerMN domain-containing protein [Selenomonadaceae bacterium]